MRITPAEHRTIAAECGKGFRSTEDSDYLPLLPLLDGGDFYQRARFDTWVVVSSSCFQFHVEVFGSVVINYYNNNTIHTHTAPCKITVTKPKCGEHQCFQAPATWEVQGVFALIQSPAFASAERFLQLPSKILSHLPQLWNLSFQLSSNFIRQSILSSQLSRLQRKSRWMWFQPRSLQSFQVPSLPRCGCEHRKNGGRNPVPITSWYDMGNYPTLQGFKHPMWCRISSINSTCGSFNGSLVGL